MTAWPQGYRPHHWTHYWMTVVELERFCVSPEDVVTHCCRNEHNPSPSRIVVVGMTSFSGRAGRIRTGDILHPKQARYQAALQPVKKFPATQWVSGLPGTIITLHRRAVRHAFLASCTSAFYQSGLGMTGFVGEARCRVNGSVSVGDSFIST